jgi:hypothetical protein
MVSLVNDAWVPIPQLSLLTYQNSACCHKVGNTPKIPIAFYELPFEISKCETVSTVLTSAAWMKLSVAVPQTYAVKLVREFRKAMTWYYSLLNFRAGTLAANISSSSAGDLPLVSGK